MIKYKVRTGVFSRILVWWGICYMGIYELITKDISAENETKRVIVSIRILYIIAFFAYVLDTIWVGIDAYKIYPYRTVAVGIMLIAFFMITYCTRTLTAVFLLMLFLFFWILTMIPVYGWSAGMQNYFIIALMMCFFTSHGRLLYKFLYAGFILIIRILAIGLYGGMKSNAGVSGFEDKLLQITNITAVFTAIIFISYYYSRRENEAENKLMKYNNKLKEEANTDQLTGLFNRRKAKEYLAEIKNADFTNGISIAMADIDFFKKVNDTYGHDAGDEVLKFVANLMKEKSRSTTFLSRWGGEEFLVVLPDCNGDNAYIVLERLRTLIENSVIKVGDQEIRITMTFGLTEFGYDMDEEAAIKEADEKLYMGKQNGRNQVVY